MLEGLKGRPIGDLCAEHAPIGPSRYHRIGHDGTAIERLFIDLFLEAHRVPPRQIVLDLDATDDPLHGHQEGRFFHGYYDCYCYLPLYVFCGSQLLAAKLRRSNIDAAAGAVGEVACIVAPDPGALVPGRDPAAGRLGLRARSADELVRGQPRRLRLRARPQRAPGRGHRRRSGRRRGRVAKGGAIRRFADFAWRTVDSWTCERRVVAKAEHLPKGTNPRFVVTSLPAGRIDARTLYEAVYCARGQVENRIKEQQLDLFADRTSAATMRANQLRLWFASFAYVLLDALRRIGLRHTQFATATCGTIRLKLLKIGAQVRLSVRRIKVAMASACPYQAEYHLAYLYLRRAAF